MESNEELNSLSNFEVVDEWSDTNLQNDGNDEVPDPGGNISQLRKPTEGEIDEFLENVKELASCGTSGFKDVLNHGSDPNCSISSECKQNLAESFPMNIKNTNVSIHKSRSTVSYKPGGTLMKTIYNESLNVNAVSSSLPNERLPTSETFASQIVNNFEISQNTCVDLREKLKKSHNLSGINSSTSDHNDNNFVVSTNDRIRSVSPRLTDLRNRISLGKNPIEQKEANLKEIELERWEQRTNSKSQIIEEVRSSLTSIDSKRSRSKENSSLSRIRERIGHGEPCSSSREFQSLRSHSKERERFDRSRSRGRLDLSRSRSRARLRNSRSRSRASFRSSRSRSRDVGRNISRSGDLRSNSRSISGGFRSSSRSRSTVIQRNSRNYRRSRRSRSRDLGRSRSRRRDHGRSSSRSRSRGHVKRSRSRSRGLGRSSRSRSRVGVIRRSNSKASRSQCSITGRSNSRGSRERIKSSGSPGRKSYISLSPSPISGDFVKLGPMLEGVL